MSTYVPIGDRVVIRRHEAREQTINGIIIPEQAQEQPQSGKVLAVGPGS